MTALPYIAGAGFVLTLVALVDIAFHVRGIQKVLKTLPTFSGPPSHSHIRGIACIGRFSVWAFREKRWELVQKCGEPGCDCGPPPSQPGEYEGHHVVKECTV